MHLQAAVEHSRKRAKGLRHNVKRCWISEVTHCRISGSPLVSAWRAAQRQSLVLSVIATTRAVIADWLFCTVKAEGWIPAQAPCWPARWCPELSATCWFCNYNLQPHDERSCGLQCSKIANYPHLQGWSYRQKTTNSMKCICTNTYLVAEGRCDAEIYSEEYELAAKMFTAILICLHRCWETPGWGNPHKWNITFRTSHWQTGARPQKCNKQWASLRKD